MLADDSVLPIVKKNYIVAMDPHNRHNATSFGVWTWIYAPDGTQVEKYWYGTGNDIITLNPSRPESEERRIAIHEKAVAGMRHALSSSLTKFEHLRAGRDGAILEVLLDDIRKNREFGTHNLDRFNRWHLRDHPIGKKLESEVALGSPRLTCRALAKAFEDAGLKVRIDLPESVLDKPGIRYSSGLATNSGWTWLSRVHRYGMHAYVDGETLVFTDDVAKAVRHYERALERAPTAGR